MLNDPDVPPCVNSDACRGTLLAGRDAPAPLNLLLVPETYAEFVKSRGTTRGESPRPTAASCIVCILFNQSATIRDLLNPDKVYLEPHPTGPVYYFNVKLSADIGVPDIWVDDRPEYVINFQGTVGNYRPTFYYSWRDMLQSLCVDATSKVSLLPVR